MAIAPSGIDRAIERFSERDKAPMKGVVEFFDTCNHELLASNVIVRLRQDDSGNAETTVKIRGAKPEDYSSFSAAGKAFKCEHDITRDWSVVSCSLSGTVAKDKMGESTQRPLKVADVLNQQQERFARIALGQSAAVLERATWLGQIPIMRWQLDARPKLAGDLMAEMWILPDSSRLLEISTRVKKLDEAGAILARLADYLTSLSLPIGSDQELKTSQALELLTKESPTCRALAKGGEQR